MSRIRGFLHSIALPNIPWGRVLWAATSANFWLSLVGMGLLIVFLWCFDLIGDLYSRIVIVGVYSAIPVLVLTQGAASTEFKRCQVDSGLVWFVLFLVASLLIAIGGRIDSAPLVLNVTTAMMAAPLAIASWLSIHRQPLVAVAVVPSVIIVALLGMLILPSNFRLEYPLLPLPFILLGVAPWSFVASKLLTCAQQVRQRSIWGPGLEVLTMLVLFIPLIVLVVGTTLLLTENEIAKTVVFTVTGVLLSSLVSAPLRQFLLDLGKLEPIRK